MEAVDYLFGVGTMLVSPLILAALVGLAVICGGMALILLMFFVRHTIRGPLRFLEMIAREGRDPDEEDSSYISAPHPNLRSIAEAQDFDSALTKHIVRDEIEPPRPHTYRPEATNLNTPPAASAPRLDAPFPDAAPRLGNAAPRSAPPPEAPFPDATPRLGSRRSDSRPSQIYDRPDDDDEDALADFMDEG